ncbi:MAG: M20/M25/M40 family metallo-hydrolase [Rubrivivax sp.]
MTFGLRRVALVAVLLSGAGPALAAPAYLTIGDAAHGLLRQIAPQAVTHARRDVAVTVPERRGSSRLVPALDGVHVVEVDEDVLPLLSLAVHERLRRCGGFVQHESLAEALTVLHRLQGEVTPDALAPSYAIDDAAQVNALLPQLQASQILATIQSLSDFQNRMYNSSHGVAASNWLFNTWKALASARPDVRVTQVRHPGWPQTSVSLLIPGSGANAAETVVLGGHLDSISPGSPETLRAPGADDDASGVASLTEVIRVLLAGNFRPSRSVEFIAYAAEEVGLRGSQQIAAKYKRQRKPVVGVLQLDMTAFQGDPTDLWIFTDYTNTAQNNFLASLAATYLPALTVGYDRCGYGCSDHASWTGKGFAASFPFEASFARSNQAIHTVNDTTATLGNQASHALKFSQLALAYVVELATD